MRAAIMKMSAKEQPIAIPAIVPGLSLSALPVFLSALSVFCGLIGFALAEWSTVTMLR